LEQLIACHDQNNWFVSLHCAIDGLTEEQASWKGEGLTNSIWEIVNHLSYWNERYLNRFKGLPVSQTKGDNDSTFYNTDDVDWPSTVERINVIMSEWRSAIKECDKAKLDSPAYKESDEPWSSVLTNLTIHNAYHIGQLVSLLTAVKMQ
jgi:uncharacterized damage-inducible protein DinB